MSSLIDVARSVSRGERKKPAGSMTLDDFARSGRVLHIWSDVLVEVVVFAADDAQIEIDADGHYKGHVIYRAAELGLLLKAAVETVRIMHIVKKEVGGKIV